MTSSTPGEDTPPVAYEAGDGAGLRQAGILHALGRLLPYLALGVFLAITASWWQSAMTVSREARKDYFEFRTREALDRIAQQIRVYEQVLYGVRGLYEGSHVVDRNEFRRYVDALNLAERYPGIQGVGFSLAVRPGDKQPHEAAVRAEGFPDYAIRPEGQRPLYTSILFLEPFADRNLRAFGYDMYSEPVRRRAMERARDHDNIAMSGKVRLVQESGARTQAGFLMYLPIYANGKPHATLAERQANLVGWAYSPFRMTDLMWGIHGEYARDLDIEIFDGLSTAENDLMYDYDESIARKAAPETDLQSRHGVEFGGHPWTIVISAAPSILKRVDGNHPLLILAVGIPVSFLLASWIWLLVHGRDRAVAHARRMNRDLIKATAHLEEQRQRLADVIWGTNVGTWEWNVQTGETRFNERWAEIVGYRLRELEPTSIETWLKLVHPDDGVRSQALLERCFKRQTDFYECEARMRHKNGQWVWILDRGRVVEWTEDGKPLRMSGTHQDITDSKHMMEKIEHLANFDKLTDLPNRVLFSDRLQRALIEARREKKHVALMFIDLDKFKPVNDLYGHRIGDLLLHEVALRMVSCVRESDTVARIGGDEFVVLLRTVENAEDAQRVAEKILVALHSPFLVENHLLNISSSIGIALFPEHGEDEVTLSGNADTAMYIAKASGRDTARVYQPAMQQDKNEA